MRFLIPLLMITPLLMTGEDDDRQRARDILQAGIADKNPDTRRDVVSAIGLTGAKEKLVSDLTPLLDDPDFKVRTAVVRALGDLNDKQAVPLLERELRDAVPEVAFAAAKVLQAMGEPSGKDALLAVYGRETKGSSNFVSAKFRDTIRQFKTPRMALMFGVRQGIGFVPVPGLGFGFEALDGMISDPEFSVRATALLLLASERSSEVVGLAQTALGDKDWSLRAVGLQILAMQGTPAERDRIARLFEDKKDRVRFRAAAAYLRLCLVADGKPPAAKQ